MENPATWGTAERIIHSVRVQHEKSRAAMVVGLSLERKITNALRQAGLLVDEEVHSPDDQAELLAERLGRDLAAFRAQYGFLPNPPGG